MVHSLSDYLPKKNELLCCCLSYNKDCNFEADSFICSEVNYDNCHKMGP